MDDASEKFRFCLIFRKNITEIVIFGPGATAVETKCYT